MSASAELLVFTTEWEKNQAYCFHEKVNWIYEQQWLKLKTVTIQYSVSLVASLAVSVRLRISAQFCDQYPTIPVRNRQFRLEPEIRL